MAEGIKIKKSYSSGCTEQGDLMVEGITIKEL